MFCNHEYKQMSLRNAIFCYKCGKIKKFDCEHKWKVHAQQETAEFNKHCDSWYATKIVNTIQTLICECCGEIISVNLTTGERK